MTHIEKFLEFHGKKITLVNEEGQFYVALKPICEVLEIDWRNEHGRVSEHILFKSTIVNITTVAADKKERDMVCLPEKFIYGWLTSLNPKTKELVDFQLECYEVLYNYFHNISYNRASYLQMMRELEQEYINVHRDKMINDKDYQRMHEIRREQKKLRKKMADWDSELQMHFDF